MQPLIWRVAYVLLLALFAAVPFTRASVNGSCITGRQPPQSFLSCGSQWLPASERIIVALASRKKC